MIDTFPPTVTLQSRPGTTTSGSVKRRVIFFLRLSPYVKRLKCYTGFTRFLTLHGVQKERICRATPPGGAQYSKLFVFHSVWVPAAYRMYVELVSRSTARHIPDPINLQRGGSGIIFVWHERCVRRIIFRRIWTSGER